MDVMVKVVLAGGLVGSTRIQAARRVLCPPTDEWLGIVEQV
jgi:hypothetical protein